VNHGTATARCSQLLRIERKPTDHQDAFTADERKALSVRAVNQLIADVEAGCLLKNKELAEVIASCIRIQTKGTYRL
jgi:putative heme iron utilization protein